jgi:hypothetical protein
VHLDGGRALRPCVVMHIFRHAHEPVGFQKTSAVRDALAGFTLAAMNVTQALGYTRIAGTPQSSMSDIFCGACRKSAHTGLICISCGTRDRRVRLGTYAACLRSSANARSRLALYDRSFAGPPSGGDAPACQRLLPHRRRHPKRRTARAATSRLRDDPFAPTALAGAQVPRIC